MFYLLLFRLPDNIFLPFSTQNNFYQRSKTKRTRVEKSPSIEFDDERTFWFPVQGLKDNHPLVVVSFFSDSQCLFTVSELQFVFLGDIQEDHRYQDIPHGIVDYIEDVIDVMGDGHCGYRAVAIGLGWNEDRFFEVREKCYLELYSK